MVKSSAVSRSRVFAVEAAVAATRKVATLRSLVMRASILTLTRRTMQVRPQWKRKSINSLAVETLAIVAATTDLEEETVVVVEEVAAVATEVAKTAEEEATTKMAATEANAVRAVEDNLVTTKKRTTTPIKRRM